MIICEKCGKILPDGIKPVRCLCQNKYAPVNLINELFTNKEKYIPQVNNTYESFPQNIIEFQQELSTVKLWEELHKHVLSENTPIWFDEWQKRIPCGECRKHWEKLIEDFPPVFKSNFDFFKWGIEAHNKVNFRLGKPIFTIQQAIEKWDRQLEFGV
jgi:hypothetical protein